MFKPKFTISKTETKARLKREVDDLLLDIQLAVDSVLTDMVNWTKDNHEELGGWTNRTGALEASIDFVPAYRFGRGNKSIRGHIFSDREYAPYVESKPNHWVLLATLFRYEMHVVNMVADILK